MANKIPRREFLKLTAASAVGLFAVTACGELLAMADRAKMKIKDITLGADNFLIRVDELARIKSANFNFNGKKAILLYNDGQIKAFENICTHKGGPSTLINNKLVCQWHGSTFDPLTGRALTSPAPSGSHLNEIGLKIKNGNIYVG